MDNRNQETEENIEISKEKVTTEENQEEQANEQEKLEEEPKMTLEEIAKREQQYRALMGFFKKDVEIKDTLIRLAPKPTDEYSEDSKIDYLEKLFTSLRDIEYKFKVIVKDFNMQREIKSSIKHFFNRTKNNLAELGYGSRPQSLQKIYQKVFTDMKPELVEKTKQSFKGYFIRRRFWCNT